MDIRSMSLAAARRSDEIMAHLNRLRLENGWFGQMLRQKPGSIWDDTLIILASVGGMPVGVLMVDKDREVGIFVDPAHRRCGVGTLLLLDAYKQFGRGLLCDPFDCAGSCFFEKQRFRFGLRIVKIVFPEERAGV